MKAKSFFGTIGVYVAVLFLARLTAAAAMTLTNGDVLTSGLCGAWIIAAALVQIHRNDRASPPKSPQALPAAAATRPK